MKHLSTALLILILLAALTIRVWDLVSVPPSLYWDEMDAGYQAYSILKTGKDYFGNTAGLIVESFADHRAPIFIYSLIPFVALFGLESWTVRLPAALFGVLNVLLIYFLISEIFKSKKTGLVAAFLIAFAPWNIQYSRMAFEATLMLSLFLLGLLAFFKSFKNSKWWIVSGISFGLSILTYNTAKLFVPLMLVVLTLLFIRIKNLNKNFWIGFIVFSIIFLAGLYSSFLQGGGQRFSEISVFTDPQASFQIDNSRNESWIAYSENGQPGMLTRLSNQIFYNKLTFFADKVIQNYLNAFSANFLFINGDSNLRHSPSKIGELYPIEFITVILGLVFLSLNFKQRKKETAFILFWLILSPIPAIITRDGGMHATRLFFFFTILSIVSALGFIFIFQSLPRKINSLTASVIVLFLLFNIGFFVNHYFGWNKLESASSFQYGFSQALEKAQAQKGQSDYIIIDDRRDSGLMNYLFDNKYDPALFQTQVKTLAFELSDIKSAKLGDVIFLDPKARDWQTLFDKKIINNNFILAVSAEQFEEQTPEKVPAKLTSNQKLLDVIYYQNNSPAFYIIESTSSATPRSANNL